MAQHQPITGTTPGYDSTDVTVTLNSAGLAPNTYTANLCVTSNDPDAGPGNETDLVIVPVNLTSTAAGSGDRDRQDRGHRGRRLRHSGKITVPAGTTVTYCYTVTNTATWPSTSMT